MKKITHSLLIMVLVQLIMFGFVITLATLDKTYFKNHESELTVISYTNGFSDANGAYYNYLHTPFFYPTQIVGIIFLILPIIYIPILNKKYLLPATQKAYAKSLILPLAFVLLEWLLSIKSIHEAVGWEKQFVIFVIFVYTSLVFITTWITSWFIFKRQKRQTKIMIFTEGTITMHKSGQGHTREERVEQAKNKDVTLHYFADYVPIGNAITKIDKWKKQGATILYLTSRRKMSEIKDVQTCLKKYHFPKGTLVYRGDDEEYKDVVTETMPNVLIEDDCESLGGVDEISITHVKPEVKKHVTSIIIKEFDGIDHLPDDMGKLKPNKSV